VAAVRYPCPHAEKGAACAPGNAPCRDGTRWIPVSVLDVPGLVPGAYAGKGLGHRFLDDLRQADGFLQIVDASGATAPDGTLTSPGAHDPLPEVEWLEEELVRWVAGILGRDFERTAKSVELEGAKLDDFLAQRLAGLQIRPPAIAAALRQVPLDRVRPSHWSPDDRIALSRALLRAATPRLVAANKCDRIRPEDAAELARRAAPVPVRPTAADAELTLRRAARAGLVDYAAGGADFRVPDPQRLSAAQRRALDEIRQLLARWGSTGVQQALEALVFDRLKRIVVFPVEDETHWTDSRGRLLPDALLVPAESPVRDVAYRVHSELGEKFVRAVDGRTHRSLASDHPLTPGSVVRIVAHR
jgi:ribosome-binding ATPase YchF (GTP1/OBG family)